MELENRLRRRSPWGLKRLAALLLAMGAGTAAGVQDRDGNGIADAWELKYFGRFLTANEVDADFSGNGFSNLAKSRFGFDPLASAFPRLGVPAVSGGTATFSFASVRGIRYQPATSPDLVTWTDAGAPLVGTGGSLSFTVTASAAKGFARLRPVASLDTDGDGLDDYEEFLFGSDPTRADADGDGLTDLEEFQLKNYFGVNVDPNNAFTVPGVKDGTGDADGDGVNDITELRGGSHPLRPTSFPANSPTVDTDGNGLPDAWERQYFGTIGVDPNADPDGDGLTNREEFLLRTNPTVARTNGVHLDGQADQDGDGVLDVWELEDGTDPFNAASVDLATNYIVLRGRMEHQSQWGPVTDQVQFEGTVMRATAIGFETAQRVPASPTFGIVNEVSGFVPEGANYASQRFLRFRKGVRYQVQITTTNNFLPFISGKFFWLTSGNGDEPENRFFQYDVTNRQRYVANALGVPVAAQATSPNPDNFNTHFTLVSPSQSGPDVTTYPNGLLNLSGIEVIDQRDVAIPADDVTVPTARLVPPPVSTDAAVIRAKNTYWQRTGNVYAWINPHRGGSGADANDPLMPQLRFRFVSLGTAYQVKWKFRCAYTRGNGLRAGQTTALDTVQIPATGTRDLPGDTPWKIYEEAGWPTGSAVDFFGGDCTITYQVFDASGGAVTQELSQNFVIGGMNPEPAKARAFIDARVAAVFPVLTYAYAIAKQESGPYSGLLAQPYNQFFTDFLPNAAVQIVSDWRAWRTGLPTFNDDRGGPGGYGIFQNTRTPAIPRAEIWHWQQNVNGFLTEISGPKRAIAQTLLNSLDRTYPGAEPRPPVSYVINGITRTVNAFDATLLTAYNGFGGDLPILPLKRADGKVERGRSCWVYFPTRPPGEQWILYPNPNNYVERVLSQLE